VWQGCSNVKENGPNGVKRRMVDLFPKTIINLTPLGVLEEVLYYVGDGLDNIAEGSVSIGDLILVNN